MLYCPFLEVGKSRRELRIPYPDDQFIRNLFPRLTIRATCIIEQD